MEGDASGAWDMGPTCWYAVDVTVKIYAVGI